MGITKSVKSEESDVVIEEYTSENGQKFLIVSNKYHPGGYDAGAGCAVSCVQIFDDGSETKFEIKKEENNFLFDERRE